MGEKIDFQFFDRPPVTIHVPAEHREKYEQVQIMRKCFEAAFGPNFGSAGLPNVKYVFEDPK